MEAHQLPAPADEQTQDKQAATFSSLPTEIWIKILRDVIPINYKDRSEKDETRIRLSEWVWCETAVNRPVDVLKTCRLLHGIGKDILWGENVFRFAVSGKCITLKRYFKAANGAIYYYPSHADNILQQCSQLLRHVCIEIFFDRESLCDTCGIEASYRETLSTIRRLCDHLGGEQLESVYCRYRFIRDFGLGARAYIHCKSREEKQQKELYQALLKLKAATVTVQADPRAPERILKP